MDAAFRALMSGLIDSAGLFPPAALPLEEALARFVEYREGKDHWMLGRFICPVERLGELREAMPLSTFPYGRPPLPISVIIRSETQWAVMLERLEGDAKLCRNFEKKLDGRAIVESLEMKMPDELMGGALAAQSFLNEAQSTLEDSLGRALPLFLERPIVGDFDRDGLEVLGAALADANSSRAKRDKPLWGLKFRCGGLEAAAFPEVKTLAAAVVIAVQRGVPFKATAGLHHPLPSRDLEIGATMQGFLNLFGGAVLAVDQELSEGQLLELLEDEAPESFRFEESKLIWRDFPISAERIIAARKLATSFGSCSFDEPREDLRALKLLEES